MEAVLGVTGGSGGLRQLGRCIDTKHESVHAKTVQCQALTLLSWFGVGVRLANPHPNPNPTPNSNPNPIPNQALTLLSAAALYSAEGHEQVLDSLDALKKTRRRMHRFGWLVEACNHEPMDEQDGGAGEVDDGDFDLDRTKTGIRRPKPGGPGAVDPDRAQHRVKGVEMVSCCLTLTQTPTPTPALTLTPNPNPSPSPNPNSYPHP